MPCSKTFSGNTYNRYDASFVQPNGASSAAPAGVASWRDRSEAERYADVSDDLRTFNVRSRGRGVPTWDVGAILRAKGHDGTEPVKDPAILRALDEYAKAGWLTPHAQEVVRRIARGDARAVKLAVDAKPPIDREMQRDLEAAARTGGVTRRELEDLFVKHASDGPRGDLTASERNTLALAPLHLFADADTAQLAAHLGAGAEVKGMTLLELRASRR